MVEKGAWNVAVPHSINIATIGRAVLAVLICTLCAGMVAGYAYLMVENPGNAAKTAMLLAFGSGLITVSVIIPTYMMRARDA